MTPCSVVHVYISFIPVITDGWFSEYIVCLYNVAFRLKDEAGRLKKVENSLVSKLKVISDASVMYELFHWEVLQLLKHGIILLSGDLVF